MYSKRGDSTWFVQTYHSQEALFYTYTEWINFPLGLDPVKTLMLGQAARCTTRDHTEILQKQRILEPGLIESKSIWSWGFGQFGPFCTQGFTSYHPTIQFVLCSTEAHGVATVEVSRNYSSAGVWHTSWAKSAVQTSQNSRNNTVRQLRQICPSKRKAPPSLLQGLTSRSGSINSQTPNVKGFELCRVSTSSHQLSFHHFLIGNFLQKMTLSTPWEYPKSQHGIPLGHWSSGSLWKSPRWKIFVKRGPLWKTWKAIEIRLVL